jgi:hypothetical protein
MMPRGRLVCTRRLAISLHGSVRKENDMKTATLCGIALLCSSASFAQSPTPAGTSPRTITLTGCVGGGAAAQPIMLSNAMIVPTTAQPAAAGGTVSPVPGAVSQPTTQPPAVAGSAAAGVGTPGTAATGVGTAGTAGAGVGTAGTGATGATGTAGAVGTAGTAGAGVGTAGTTGAGVGTAGTASAGVGAAGATASTPPATTGTPGAPVTSNGQAAGVSGTAPAGSSASSVSGYRLSGVDMTGWVGRRVQLVGTLAPTTTPTSEANPAMNATATTPEFRVVSVQPATGNCPPQQ